MVRAMIANRLNSHPGVECVLPPPDGTEITAAFTSDLLSDVVANAPENSILVTIQAHQNTVAVATLAGIRAILTCSGRNIPDDMAASAREHGIGLYRTSLNQYEASILVHDLLASDKDPS